MFGSLSKSGEDPSGLPSVKALWAVNLIVAILFGLGHLPATAFVFPLTSLVVTRAIVLNGLGGLVFGYLYWTRGLEASMLAHLCADIVLLTSSRLFNT